MKEARARKMLITLLLYFKLCFSNENLCLNYFQFSKERGQEERGFNAMRETPAKNFIYFI